jgi:hypothetical protein
MKDSNKLNLMIQLALGSKSILVEIFKNAYTTSLDLMKKFHTKPFLSPPTL